LEKRGTEEDVDDLVAVVSPRIYMLSPHQLGV